MFSNYVTFTQPRKTNVAENESRHGGVTLRIFRQTEAERQAHESAYETVSGARVAYPRGVFTHLASAEVHFPRPRREITISFAKRRGEEREADSHGKRRDLVPPTRPSP